MIQAPQMQYIPQPFVQPGYQQGAYIPVQQQYTPMPGAIYNYPASSSYMPLQNSGQTKYNGVNIGITNPQGQAPAGYYGNPMPNYMTYPVQSPSQGQYNGVNIEILNPQGVGAGCQQPLMPAQFYPSNQAFMPSYPPQIQAPPIYQNLPPSPLYPPQQPVYPQQQHVYPALNPINEQSSELKNSQNVPPPPVIEQPSTPKLTVSPEAFAGRLQTNDLDKQLSAIEELAIKVKDAGDDGKALVTSEIFDSLIDIINRDTSKLETPSAETISARENMSGEDIEKTLSPFEKAEKNKQCALFTIAYMDELIINEMKKLKNETIPLKDLPAINTIVETIKSNENPELRKAGISALSYLDRPEYSNDIGVILEIAQADEDPDVSADAENAYRNLAA